MLPSLTKYNFDTVRYPVSSYTLNWNFDAKQSFNMVRHLVAISGTKLKFVSFPYSCRRLQKWTNYWASGMIRFWKLFFLQNFERFIKKEYSFYSFLGPHICTNFKKNLQWSSWGHWKVFCSRCDKISFKQSTRIQGVWIEIFDISLHLPIDNFIRNAKCYDAKPHTR